MDTITTIPDLLTCNGSARPVTVSLTPSEHSLIAAAPELLAACKAQHEALGILFAMLIARSPRNDTYSPSKSGRPWEALEQGHAAIVKAEAP